MSHIETIEYTSAAKARAALVRFHANPDVTLVEMLYGNEIRVTFADGVNAIDGEDLIAPITDQTPGHENGCNPLCDGEGHYLLAVGDLVCPEHNKVFRAGTDVPTACPECVAATAREETIEVEVTPAGGGDPTVVEVEGATFSEVVEVVEDALAAAEPTADVLEDLLGDATEAVEAEPIVVPADATRDDLRALNQKHNLGVEIPNTGPLGAVRDRVTAAAAALIKTD